MCAFVLWKPSQSRPAVASGLVASCNLQITWMFVIGVFRVTMHMNNMLTNERCLFILVVIYKYCRYESEYEAENSIEDSLLCGVSPHAEINSSISRILHLQLLRLYVRFNIQQL